MGTCKQPLPTVGSLDDARKSSSRRGEAGFSKNQLRTYARGKRVYVASAGGAQASPSCPREEWDRQWSKEARAGEVLDSLSHRKIQPWGPKRCGSLAAVKVVRVTLSFHLLFFFSVLEMEPRICANLACVLPCVLPESCPQPLTGDPRQGLHP